MNATDIALALGKQDRAWLREAAEHGHFRVHKLNTILDLIQHRLVSARADENPSKGYLCVLTAAGRAVASVLTGK